MAALPFHALNEAARLLAAAGIGLLVTTLDRRSRRGRAPDRSLQQTHVLLTLAGALTMLIVGDSMPRAFGIAGAAAIIRFRTPVDDPRDVTVLFLLMALGMAAGLGLATVAAVGTLFLCACLLLHGGGAPPRSAKVALIAEGTHFPAARVSHVFAEHQVAVEPLEFSHGEQLAVRYRARIDGRTSLADVSAALVRDGGIASVSWELSKKRA